MAQSVEQHRNSTAAVRGFKTYSQALSDNQGVCCKPNKEGLLHA